MPDVRYASVLIVVALLLVAGVVAGLTLGHGNLNDDAARGIYLSLRACRVSAAALAGAGLALGGVLMQGLFRNPLASPDVLGTSAGAHIGGQLVLLGFTALSASLPHWMAPEMVLPLGCLIGAGAALAILVAVAGRAPGLVTVLLAGVILTALFGSVSAFLTSLGQDSWQLGRALVAFSLGGVDGKGVRHLALAAPLILISGGAAWGWGRSLDLMLSGEEEAAALGVDVNAVRRWALVWTAVLAAAAVALGGGVAFVGLVVPHALRRFTGVAHRRLIPAAALGGAAFLVWCDDLARALPTIGEVPLGVITGLIGAPLFLAILLQARRQVEA